MPSQPFGDRSSIGTGGGLRRGFVLLLVVLASVRPDATANAAPIPGEKSTRNGHDPNQPTRGGWRKHPENRVLGGDLGTCFDVAVLHQEDQYSMYFSWRPRSAIARVTSKDGIRWSEPTLVLGPSDSGWEGRVNRPAVLTRNGVVHLWYTGQTKTQSFIGYATSNDGIHFKRIGNQPVLSPDQPWEKVAVMCPHVIWDDQAGRYRMWYSGGEQYEPDAIGYATSRDGVHWEKHARNPVFRADPEADWERAKVTGCEVIRHGDWHLMFYIGFADEHTARIGLARSRDGITGWQRHPANPLISPTTGQWDGDACYKPFALFDGDRGRWLLWYNGRRGGSEQIGLAIHEGQDLGWESAERVPPASSRAILRPEASKQYVDRFNALDEEQHRVVRRRRASPQPMTITNAGGTTMARCHKTVAAWLTAVLSLSVLGWTAALPEDQPIKTGVFAGGNDALFSLASAGEEAAVDVPVVEGIRGIKPPRPRRLPGFRRAKPTVIEDQDALGKTFGDARAKKISGQGDLDQQVLVLFQWAGSGQDKLTYAVRNEDDGAKVIFKFRAGRTRDLRPHARLYAIRKGIAWRVAK